MVKVLISDKLSPLAKEIFELGHIQCVISPITTNQYPTPARRPMNTLMNKDKFFKINNINCTSWKLSLSDCVKRIRSN